MLNKCEMCDCEIDKFESETKCVLHCDKTLSNKWIISKTNTREENSTKTNLENIMQWNQKKIDYFWETLFQEIKNKIIKSVRKKKPLTTQEAVRILGIKKETGFRLNFLHIKFPPITKSLNKYISSNNQIIIKNDFQNCTFYDNCVINSADIEAVHDKKQLIIKQKNENTNNNFYDCIFEQNFIIFRPYSKYEHLYMNHCKVKKNYTTYWWL